MYIYQVSWVNSDFGVVTRMPPEVGKSKRSLVAKLL